MAKRKKKIYRKINNVKLVKKKENNQLKSKLQQRKEARQKYLVGTYRAINKAAKNVKWVDASVLNEITDIYYEILRRFPQVNSDSLYDLVVTHYDMYIAGSQRKRDYRYTRASYMEAYNKVLKAIKEETITEEQEKGLKEFLIDKIGEDSFYVDIDYNIQPALFIAKVEQLGI